MTRSRIIGIFLVLLLAIPIVAQMPQEKVDLDAIYRIKDEGLNRSQVMDSLSYLTDDDTKHSQHGRNRSSFVRRRGFARLPVHTRPRGVQQPDASFQHGCVRSRSDGGYD